MQNQGPDDGGLAARVRRLEDRAAIRELVSRYGFAVDDRNIESLAALFSADARFRSLDGAMDAVGREAVIRQFHGRYASLGPTHHFTHDLVLCFDDSDPDRAHGQLSSHAEVVRNGRPMITALRYADTYRRSADGWQFEERVLSFLYYLPVEEYAEAMKGPLRMRAYGDPRPADFPENLASWKRYRNES